MKLILRAVILALLLAASQLQAVNALVKVTNVSLSRVPPDGPSAAVYLSLKNEGNAPLHLVGVSTDVARHAGVHQVVIDGGMSKMRPQKKLVVLAGQQLDFLPGGYHIMLMGLEQKTFDNGFELTLEFLQHPPVSVVVLNKVRHK